MFNGGMYMNLKNILQGIEDIKGKGNFDIE